MAACGWQLVLCFVRKLITASPVPQEAVKINQGTGIWVEDCNFGYGWNAAFDCSEWCLPIRVAAPFTCRLQGST